MAMENDAENQGNAQRGQPPRARKRSRYTPHACQRCQKAKVRCAVVYAGAEALTLVQMGAYRVLIVLLGKEYAITAHRRRPTSKPTFESLSKNAPWVCEAVVTEIDRDEPGGFQAEISQLLRQQNEKLDLLIKKTATIEAAYEAVDKSDVRAVAAVLPPRKEPLPLFQTSTAAFFCVNVVDAGVRKLQLDHLQERIPTFDASSTQARTALSIIQGEVVTGEASDISRSEFEEPVELLSDSSSDHQEGSAHSTTGDVLHGMEPDLLLRAVQAFADLDHPMYPILDMTDIMQKAKQYSEFTSGARSRGMHSSESHDIDKDDLAQLKMVVSIGLLAQGDAQQKLAAKLFASVRRMVEDMVWSATVDLKDLIVMALVTLYHFHCGRWRLAWRFQGNVSRIILELGLNRRVVLDRSFPDLKTKIQAINTVWTIFVLEQHLSYALGFSNAMANLRLESSFPQPVDAPYLTLMIEYASIGKQSCDALLNDKVLSPEQLATWQDDYAYFQYRVSMWAIHASESFVEESSNPGIQMLRTILHLRIGHLRTLIARAFLCSGLRKAAPLDIWTTSVDIAADTVKVIVQLDTTKEEYRFHQSQLNHFLVSALDILLFATSHQATGVGSPYANGQELVISEATTREAQQSSMVALDRLRSLADTSSQSKYLWERVRGLAIRLNLIGNLLPATSAMGILPTTQVPPDPRVDDMPSPLWTTMNHTVPLTEQGSGEMDRQYVFSLPPDDLDTWSFQLSSELDFDLPPDPNMLNTTWMPGNIG